MYAALFGQTVDGSGHRLLFLVFAPGYKHVEAGRLR